MASVHQINRLQRTAGVEMQHRHVPSVGAQPCAVPRAMAFPRRHQQSTFAMTMKNSRAVSLVVRAGPMGEQFEADNKRYAELTKAIEVRR